MTKLICSIGLGAILVTACASGADSEIASDAERTHVDLVEVVEVGNVVPVDNITSAGQPGEAAFTVFAESGYVAVIDIRGPDENRGLDEVAVIESLQMQYIALPISGAAEISFESAQKLDELLESIDGPVLIHCGSGNRVGALLALRASSSGASDEAAIEHGLSSGLTGLEPLVRERLAEK